MTQLMETYGGALRRTARELIGKSIHLDSVDLVQSVQMILWLGLRTGKFSVDTPDSLLGLAKTLLKRKIARSRQGVKPRKTHSLDGKGASALAQVRFAAGGHAERTQITALDDLVEDFLDQLGDLDRRLLNLRLMGHSTTEVARQLNIDSGWVRVRLGRLRARFTEFQHQLTQWPVHVPTETSDP